MSNVPVGPNRVNTAGHGQEEAPKEPWRESVAASSRNAGNSFKAADRQPKTSGKKVKLIGIAVAALVIVGLFFFLLARQSNPAGLIDGSRYQAVFFTNGQVYFGKLSSIGGDYYKLTDIYYIQSQQAPTNTDSDNPQETDGSPQSNDTKLVKLGDEIHGPEDSMIINRDQVLFFENLKKDGKVTNVINQHKQQKQ